MKPYDPRIQILLFLVLFVIFPVRGQSIKQPALTKDSLSRTKSIPAGGPRGFISCSLKDKVGNLWFGTVGEGIFYYNGTSFARFTGKQGLMNDHVSALYEDDKGLIWIGTQLGVSCYDGDTFTNISMPYKDSFSFLPLYGTAGVMDPLPQRYPVSGTVGSIVQDTSGKLWFGTGSGVYCYDPSAGLRTAGKNFTRFLQDGGALYNGAHHNVIQSGIKDRSGNLWFASFSHGGIYRYDGISFTNFMQKEGLSDDMIFCLLSSRNGDIWIGTRDYGVCRYDGRSFAVFKRKDGLCHNNVSCIFEDKAGNLWFGSDRGGLCRYDGISFTDHSNKEGLNNRSVRTILEDDSGHLWVGTRDGLYLYDGASFTRVGE